MRLSRIRKRNLNTTEYWNRIYARKVVTKKLLTKKRIVYYEVIEEWLKNGQGIFEIGCGFGYGLNYLCKRKNLRGTGVDLSDCAIKHARQKFPLQEFMVFDVLKDEIPETHYIIIIQTLEHLEDTMGIVEKCKKSCRELIITVPYAKCCAMEKSHIIFNFDETTFPSPLDLFTFCKDQNIAYRLKGNL